MMIQRRLFLAGLAAFAASPVLAQNAAGVTFEGAAGNRQRREDA